MLIRSILTIAVLGSFVFGAAANATERTTGFTAPGDIAGIVTPSGVAPPGTPWAGR